MRHIVGLWPTRTQAAGSNVSDAITSPATPVTKPQNTVNIQYKSFFQFSQAYRLVSTGTLETVTA
jgi:hypothetical protein